MTGINRRPTGSPTVVQAILIAPARDLSSEVTASMSNKCGRLPGEIGRNDRRSLKRAAPFNRRVSHAALIGQAQAVRSNGDEF